MLYKKICFDKLSKFTIFYNLVYNKFIIVIAFPILKMLKLILGLIK